MTIWNGKRTKVQLDESAAIRTKGLGLGFLVEIEEEEEEEEEGFLVELHFCPVAF